ncbi:MAG: M12 family metallo-peptidase [Acidobacteriota bacterium]
MKKLSYACWALVLSLVLSIPTFADSFAAPGAETLLLAEAASFEPPFALSVAVHGGGTVTAIRQFSGTRWTSDGRPIRSWDGVVLGKPESTLTLTTLDEKIRGNLSLDGMHYSVTGTADGLSVAPTRKHAVSCTHPEHTHADVPGKVVTPVAEEISSFPVTLDLLVLYEPEPDTVLGSIAELELEAEHAVTVSNAAFARSDLLVSVRTVGFLPYPEYDENDPFMTGMLTPRQEALRAEHKADLVTLITDDGFGAVLAGLVYWGGRDSVAYSLVDRLAIINNPTILTHEIGHNLGARHDLTAAGATTPPGIPDGGYGQIWCPPGDERGWRTIMANGTSPCFYTDVPYFSNPDILLDGIPTGIPEQADNARTIRLTAPVVARYRLSGNEQLQTELPLLETQFRVNGLWRNIDGDSGPIRPSSLSDNTGLFWFFNEANAEVFIKMLNGCSVNGHYWVFIAGLTNLEVTIGIRDVVNENYKVYTNPLRTAFEPIQDTQAFPCE